MKYTHFDDICPNHRTDFVMLYFAACRSLRELQAAIRRTNGGNLTCRQAWLLRRIQNKFVQMVARLKATQPKFEIAAIMGKKPQKSLIVSLPNAITDADIGQMLSTAAKHDTKHIFIIVPTHPASAQHRLIQTINDNTKIKITVLITSDN